MSQKNYFLPFFGMAFAAPTFVMEDHPYLNSQI